MLTWVPWGHHLAHICRALGLGSTMEGVARG